jgi:hypothetical protein
MVMKSCPKCETQHSKSGIFCSRKCANSRTFSIGTKEKKREKAIESRLRRGLPLGKTVIEKECIICKSIHTLVGKTCSRECKRLYQSRGQKERKAGGYREGSGRSNSGYYKEIFCGSTYELIWVIYRLDRNLLVKRFKGYLSNEILKYYPDFIENNHIFEIKGYWTDSVDKKTELAKENGYTISVLYKQDLEKEFDWVKTKYKYKHITELYDNYKPSYTFNCEYCGHVFNTEIKKETDVVFCSRRCAGLGHKGRKQLR